jgi:4-hydroxy-4-methyl-2-oxoglutarate aldolase
VTGRGPRWELAADLRRYGAATVGECGGQVAPPSLVPLDRSASFAGPAITARCAPGDNLGVHAAIAAANPGDVVVVACDGDPERGYLGEVLARAALARRVAGVVVDGGVRDTAQILALGLPVVHRLVALRGATKHGPAWLHHPVVVASVPVADGDWVVGDADGVAVVPAADLDRVAAAARQRYLHEQQVFAALAEGRSTLEVLGIDARAVDRLDGRRNDRPSAGTAPGRADAQDAEE